MEECLGRARALYSLGPEALQYHEGPPVTILGDLDEVRAAVSNLIDNAIKYSGSDVNVVVETAKLDGNNVAVRVKDQGRRHSEAGAEAHFQAVLPHSGPAGDASQRDRAGTYTSFVPSRRRHGGRAWAESEGPGHGSTFVLQLPISR